MRIRKYENFEKDKTLDKSAIIKSADISFDINRPSILPQMTFKPAIPSKVFGRVYCMSSAIFYFRERILELDPAVGCLKRFKTINDYPNNPK